MASYFAPHADAAAYVAARAAQTGQTERLAAWNLYYDCSDSDARRAYYAVYIRLADLDDIAAASGEDADSAPCDCSIFRRLIEGGCPACNPRRYMVEA